MALYVGFCLILGIFVLDDSDGLVSLEEIVSNLSDPENSVKSSTRTLKIAFKMDELEPYLDTII